MTTFWILAAALALTAPLFIAVPLLRGSVRRGRTGGEPSLSVYREQFAELQQELRSGRLGEDEYSQARAELEQRLVEEVPETAAPPVAPAAGGAPSRAAALMAMIALPLAGAFLYVALGNPAALRPEASEAAHGVGPQQLESMVVRLAARLERSPQDASGWAMLARAQSVMGRFEAASAAYERAVELRPGDAQLLADHADALAMVQGGHLRGGPERLIEQALQIDPGNAKALALAGTVAFQKKDYPLAIVFWERLRAAVPATSEFAASVERNIDEARGLAAAAGSRAASQAPAARISSQ